MSSWPERDRSFREYRKGNLDAQERRLMGLNTHFLRLFLLETGSLMGPVWGGRWSWKGGGSIMAMRRGDGNIINFKTISFSPIVLEKETR